MSGPYLRILCCLLQVMASSRKLPPGSVRRPGCQRPVLTLGVAWRDLSSTGGFMDGALPARREEKRRNSSGSCWSIGKQTVLHPGALARRRMTAASLSPLVQLIYTVLAKLE